MSKLLKGTIKVGFGAALMYGVNRCINYYATVKEILKSRNKAYYTWKFGDIYYSKLGEGKPVLLIHHLDPSCSGYEWHVLKRDLAKDHTVYTVDLPGYGRSFKEKMIYTNFIFVSAMNDFVRDVIGEKTDVITSGDASSIAIMACHSKPELYGKVVAISPESFNHMIQYPTEESKKKYQLFTIPILGTFIYNMTCTHRTITKAFTSEYFNKCSVIQHKWIDAFHEAAHTGGFNARFTMASRTCGYMNMNAVPALKAMEQALFVICGECSDDQEKTLVDYAHFKPDMKGGVIADTKAMPHMESPKATAAMIREFIG